MANKRFRLQHPVAGPNGERLTFHAANEREAGRAGDIILGDEQMVTALTSFFIERPAEFVVAGTSFLVVDGSPDLGRVVVSR